VRVAHDLLPGVSAPFDGPEAPCPSCGEHTVTVQGIYPDGSPGEPIAAYVVTGYCERCNRKTRERRYPFPRRRRDAVPS